MTHRIDMWISCSGKPGQAEEQGEPKETITSFAFSLENGLNPPNQQKSGLEESFPVSGGRAGP